MFALTFTAAFLNLALCWVMFRKRNRRYRQIPWAQFFVSTTVSELAWVLLAIQVLFAGIWVICTPLNDSMIEILALLVLSWSGWIYQVFSANQAGVHLEKALINGLGMDYRSKIADERKSLLRSKVNIGDWIHPLGMARPGVECIKDVAYGPHGIRQRLDIYRPAGLANKDLSNEPDCPVLLQIHGGGFITGNKDTQALPLMYDLASRGWICVAINYRLSPSVGWPTHLMDCKKALCWIRERGREYGMNPDFVAVTGGSAGGQLTTLMALTGNWQEFQPEAPDTDTRVQTAVPYYAGYDMMSRNTDHINRDTFHEFMIDKIIHARPEEDPELWVKGSPIDLLDEIEPDTIPPIMAIHGTQDSILVIDYARRFIDKLKAISKQSVVYAEVPGVDHAFDNLRGFRTQHCNNAVQRYLEYQYAVWSKAEDRD